MYEVYGVEVNEMLDMRKTGLAVKGLIMQLCYRFSWRNWHESIHAKSQTKKNNIGKTGGGSR